MRRASLLLLVTLIVVAGFEALTEEDSSTTNVLMVVSFLRFSYDEYTITRGILEQEGFNVTVGCSRLGRASSSVGNVDVDTALPDVDVSEIDAVVFIGGWGAEEYFEDEQAHRISQQAADQGKLLAAICLAPVILANAGVLEGREATVFFNASASPWSRPALKAGGATYVDDTVVVSTYGETRTTIITASGVEASHDFGRAVAAALKPDAEGGGTGLSFYDSFDDPASGWPGGSWAETGADYRGGQYAIWINEPYWPHLSWSPPAGSFSEPFVAEATGYTHTLTNDVGHGLVWGKGNDDFYAFIISATGYYTVWLQKDGEWQDDPVPWTASRHIQTEAATNRVAISVAAGEATLRVNGEFLKRIPLSLDGPFFIGLMASAFQDVPAEVRFTSFYASVGREE